ncbi:hypothetical protein P7L74_02945 (plasmid) [Tistrella mobilis]|uniref:calcium-binding protein n=1 Tax=Tistrella mobilis TaxID=171437 RepID=UPI0035572E88
MPQIFAPGTFPRHLDDLDWDRLQNAPVPGFPSSEDALQPGETAVWRILSNDAITLATDYAADAGSGLLTPGVEFSRVTLIQRGSVETNGSSLMPLGRSIEGVVREDVYLDSGYDAAFGSRLIFYDVDVGSLPAETQTRMVVDPMTGDPDRLVPETTTWYNEYILVVEATAAASDTLHDRFVVTDGPINAAREAVWGEDWLPQPSGPSEGITRIGSAGAEILSGTMGDDVLRGLGGADRLEGGEGHDIASYVGNAEGVVVSLASGTTRGGDAAGDVLLSIEGIEGSSFADRLLGDQGANTLLGGGGDDELIGRAGGDLLDGGEGTDTVSYEESAGAVRIDLLAGTAAGGDATGDILRNVENLTGSRFNDRLAGDDHANILFGGDGDDVLQGRGGGDRLWGGRGFDIVSYADAEAAVGSSLAASGGVSGIAAGDQYTSVEGLEGSGFDDHLTGDQQANTLLGLAGDDVLRGHGGADRMDGGEGFDTVSYSDNDTGVVISLLTGTSWGGHAQGDVLINIEAVEGSTKADRLAGDAGVNTLSGLGGDDILRGRGGADRLDGGEGFDTVTYSDSRSGVVVSLLTSVTRGGDAQGDVLTDIEGIEGSGHADRLLGSGGVNHLSGLDGNDELYGRGGADVLTGGGGADRFAYESVRDSGATGSSRDLITDFSQADGDRIDLSIIDADTGHGGNQAFTFIGAAAFTGMAGELRAVGSTDVTTIFADVDGDGQADLSITLAGLVSLVPADFVL